MPASGKQLLVYTVTDLNGNTHQVPVEPSGTNATWAEIIQAATNNGITIGNKPSGYNGDWKSNGAALDVNSTTELSPNQPITPDFTKSLTYTVGADTITVSVKYPETEATWDQIKTAAKDKVPTFDENLLWKDGNGKLVSSPKKYPAGTSFTSSTSTNAATGGSAERVVTVDQPNRTPQIGDKLYKDPNGKGWIIAKADPSKDTAIDWTLLGHVYDVDTTNGVVSVVSKEIGDAKWARQTGAVYDGKSPKTGVDRLSNFLTAANVTNGYDAWIDIGGDFEINASDKVINKGDKAEVSSSADVQSGTAWNPDALFRNYDAISWALCYPASNKTRKDLSSTHPLYSSSDAKNIMTYLTDTNAKSWTKEVVKIVNGNTVESRWYLPSVAELKKVHAAGARLLNWSDLSNEKFWSVEVNVYAGDYNETEEEKAKYVNFTTGNDGTINKMTPNYKVLAVSQFNYTTM